MISCFCTWLLWAMGGSLQLASSAAPSTHLWYPVLQDTLPPGAPAPCLSGVINQYTPVLGFGCDSSTLSVGSSLGFGVGDEVVLVQMQVPQVELSNTSAFGTLLNTVSIGNYGFNRVLSINGNQVQLQFELQESYDLSGKVQLVRVPEYDSVTVCNLTCLPWNGVTGGILALDVKSWLNLSGNIDVSAAGFRGGVVEPNLVPWVFGEMQYTYPPLSTLAGQKGEGIVQIPLEFSYGRGRAGNGGGGGNAHNGGGGGGGNAGNGGDGGLEISNLPNLPAPNTNGIGGQGYFGFQANKILMGGGGGAGHANDALGSAGGTGGGIILVKAGAIQSNGFQILANGENVPGAVEHNDGQGGGGSGGTILLDFDQLIGPLSCALRGGYGGSNPYTPDFQIHGPGGGGGGGKLLCTQNTTGIIADLSGGQNGLTSQGLTNGAFPGGTGSVLSNVKVSTSETLAYPISPNYSLALQQPTCPGSTDGRIEVLQSTAKAWRLNQEAWQNQPVFDSLGPGFYHITLLFSGGCTLDTAIKFLEPIPIQDSLLAFSDETCLAGGSIRITGIQGVAPFEYQINNNAWQNSGNFPDLLPGAYVLHVRDARNCSTTTFVSIAPHPVPPVPMLQARAGCLGLGVIEVGQTQAQSISLNGGVGQAEPIFPDLLPGNYQIHLLFPDGCTFDTTLFLPAIPPLKDNVLSLMPANCVMGGQLMVEAMDGVPPYTFQLDNGMVQSNGTFNNLSPGTVLVQIQDSLGCTLSLTREIAAPVPLEGGIVDSSGITCLQKGQITVIGNLGTPPYTYQIDGGAWQTSTSFTEINAGAHVLYFRDAGGCTDSLTVYFPAVVPVRDTLLVLEQPDCIKNGRVILDAYAGTAPFVFQIQGGAWQSNGQFTDLPPGAYVFHVRDALGCVDSLQCTLFPPLVPLPMQVAVFPACQQMARIEVQQSQALAYRLNQGAVQLDSVFSGLIPGTYFLEILLPQNCRLDTTIIVPAAPSLGDTILAVRAITCDTLGACTVQPVGGTSPFLYQLNPGFWQNTGYFQDLAAGSYTLQVQDALGCIATDTFSILPYIPLNGQIDQLIGDQCNRADGAIELSVYGGTPPYVYQLNGVAAQSAPVFEGLSAGLYTLEVIDAADCRHFLTVQVPTLGDTAYTQEVVQLFEGDSYVLPDGRRIFKPGTFVFQNQTILGCDSTHVIILQIFPRNVYIPNVFYPSSGGENAFFTIFSDASLEAISRLSIYDRWGELLFDAREMAPNQESMGWDGTFRGKSMETGVYVWFATVRFVDGVVWTLKGDLTLFR